MKFAGERTEKSENSESRVALRKLTRPSDTVALKEPTMLDANKPVSNLPVKPRPFEEGDTVHYADVIYPSGDVNVRVVRISTTKIIRRTPCYMWLEKGVPYFSKVNIKLAERRFGSTPAEAVALALVEYEKVAADERKFAERSAHAVKLLTDWRA